MFVDQATIFVKAGAGGAGSSSIRREPYRPKGGPDGGDGGKGGDVILRVDPSMFDLSRYRDRPHHRAKNGRSGSSNNRHGASGEDLVLPVPDGTIVRDERGLLADLVGEGASVVVARGGRGGRGNASLSSARNRVPRVAERGASRLATMGSSTGALGHARDQDVAGPSRARERPVPGLRSGL